MITTTITRENTERQPSPTKSPTHSNDAIEQLASEILEANASFQATLAQSKAVEKRILGTSTATAKLPTGRGGTLYPAFDEDNKRYFLVEPNLLNGEVWFATVGIEIGWEQVFFFLLQPNAVPIKLNNSSFTEMNSGTSATASPFVI